MKTLDQATIQELKIELKRREEVNVDAKRLILTNIAHLQKRIDMDTGTIDAWKARLAELEDTEIHDIHWARKQVRFGRAVQSLPGPAWANTFGDKTGLFSPLMDANSATNWEIVK